MDVSGYVAEFTQTPLHQHLAANAPFYAVLACCCVYILFLRWSRGRAWRKYAEVRAKWQANADVVQEAPEPPEPWAVQLTNAYTSSLQTVLESCEDGSSFPEIIREFTSGLQATLKLAGSLQFDADLQPVQIQAQAGCLDVTAAPPGEPRQPLEVLFFEDSLKSDQSPNENKPRPEPSH